MTSDADFAFSDDDIDPLESDQTMVNQESALDLEGADLKALTELVHREYSRARDNRKPIIARADRNERAYNLEPYPNEMLPYMDALSIRLPSSVSRVDRTASELAGTFDRDGAPLFTVVPASTSTVPLAGHLEKMFHEILTNADATRFIRRAIHRAVKVGTGFLAPEIVSTPISAVRAALTQDDTESDLENNLVLRSPKIQDMYWTPVYLEHVKDAAFIGERFQMPRYRLEDMMSEGFYVKPTDGEAEEELSWQRIDTDDGRNEEQRRLGTWDEGSRGLMSDTAELIRCWVRFRASTDTRSQLYYVVFPLSNPSKVIRVKRNQYALLDSAPYVALAVDEGDGVFLGRSWMEILEDLQVLQDTLSMLRIEQAKRAYANIWIARKGSSLADEIEDRRGEAAEQAEFSESGLLAGDVDNAGATRFLPDEVFVSESPEGDLKRVPMTESNPAFQADEQRIENQMNQATIDSAPLGGIRSAFEVRQAASQASAKYKTLLKTVVSTGLAPLAAMIQAMAWEYLMPELEVSDQIKLIQYGDTKYPITISDYFAGVRIMPAGSTTSADQAVALTSTADLVNQIVPLLSQVPGIVPDVPKAIREILKLRLKALGISDGYEAIIGLSEPTPEDMEKAAQYMQILRALNANQSNSIPQTAMGADGGIGLGLGNVAQGNPVAGDQTGGSQDGIAPNMLAQLGASGGQTGESGSASPNPLAAIFGAN